MGSNDITKDIQLDIMVVLHADLKCSVSLLVRLYIATEFFLADKMKVNSVTSSNEQNPVV